MKPRLPIAPVLAAAALSLPLFLAGCTPAGEDAARPAIPAGLPALAVPADNPMTPEKVELGKLLYFDTRLSKDGTVSCASCHDPKKAWAESSPTSTGINKQVGGRNSPTVINAAFMKVCFWDGRAGSLEEQALGPIENPVEMGHKLADLVQELAKVPEYEKRFKAVFGTGVTQEGIAKAIAAFERTVLSGDSPYDRYAGGKKDALGESQKKGLAAFTRAGCDSCHTPPLFTNSSFYNAGVGMDRVQPDEGRRKVTKEDNDLGKFRVPTLREISATGPYFHDGSVPLLADAVEVMAGGGKDNPNLSPILKGVREANLSPEERKDVVEFLKALSGSYPVTEAPKVP